MCVGSHSLKVFVLNVTQDFLNPGLDLKAKVSDVQIRRTGGFMEGLDCFFALWPEATVDDDVIGTCTVNEPLPNVKGFENWLNIYIEHGCVSLSISSFPELFRSAVLSSSYCT